MTQGIGHVDISHGDKTLLSSGSIITFGPGETLLEITLANERLRLIIEFVSEDEPKYARHEFAVVDEQTLRLKLINFNSPLSIHPNEPIELGTIARRKLWFTYSAADLQNSVSKQFLYAFYVGPEMGDAAN